MFPLLLSSVLLLPGLVALSITRDVAQAGAETVPRERGAMPLKLLITIAVVSLLFIVAASAGQSFYNVYMDTVLKAPTQLIG